jgi:hypothetical protein
MSRWRIGAKIRKNADFKAMTAFLDANRLSWEIADLNSSGHPVLRITQGTATLDHVIAGTPKPRGDTKRKVASLKRALAAAGMLTLV